MKADLSHLSSLVHLGEVTFIESHGHSAAPEDVRNYIERTYTNELLQQELESTDNYYEICFWKNEPVGFSKIRMNQPLHAASFLSSFNSSDFQDRNYAKLDRIYLLASHHGKGIATSMFERQLQLAYQENQKGIWLYTWVENKRAIAFYEKMGFERVGQYDFQISANRKNPNWVMYRDI
jgi:ribosomal protein S18 acetylase RimI-like enzyme